MYCKGVNAPRMMNDSPEWYSANFVPDATCPKCGHYIQYKSRYYPCLCDRVQKLSLMVGKPLARSIYESPWSKTESITKKPLHCYRLHMDERTLHSILKSIYFRGGVSTFRIITDQQIVSIWLDKGGKEENLIEGDIKQSLYSSLRPHALLIIHLGVMSSKNSAAADVLADAINIRLMDHQPVWVWDKPSKPYNEDSTCWGSSVLDIIQEFESISFDSASIQSTSVPLKPGSYLSAPDMNKAYPTSSNKPREPTLQSVRPDSKRSAVAPQERNALSEYGSGLDKSKSKRRSGPGKGQFSKEVDYVSRPIEDD
jgi:hypothetical protein